jgi:phenylacetate-CoA ligase
MTPLSLLSLTWRFARFSRSQYWPAEKIEIFQSKQLVAMLKYASCRVPFYRDYDIDPASIRSPDDLARFPILTKRQIQESPGRFIADGFETNDLFESRSSGSTGEPLTTYFDRSCWLDNKLALKIRRTLSMGLVNARRVMVVADEQVANQGDVFRLPGPFGGIAFKRISILDDSDRAIKRMREFRPTALYSFPSWLIEIIHQAEKTGLDLPKIPVIYTSSEVLTETVRERIAGAFGAYVCDVYGNTEFKEIAWQCREGRYHVNFESTWVESCPDPEQRSKLLVLTSLNNSAMPLIRYSVQDRGHVGQNPCLCGRQSPFLFDISGRHAEILVLPDGRHLSPYVLSTAIESHPAIYRYQLVQPKDASLLVNYLARTDYPDDRLQRELAKQILSAIGSDMTLRFKRCDAIERGPAGKHRILIQPGDD